MRRNQRGQGIAVPAAFEHPLGVVARFAGAVVVLGAREMREASGTAGPTLCGCCVCGVTVVGVGEVVVFGVAGVTVGPTPPTAGPIPVDVGPLGETGDVGVDVEPCHAPAAAGAELVAGAVAAVPVRAPVAALVEPPCQV